MTNEAGLICAFLLDGDGKGTRLRWPDVRAWRPEDGLLWIHLDASSGVSERWLFDESKVEHWVADALLNERARPRSQPAGDGLLVAFRGINLNEGADPEDMISIRAWIESSRIITMRTEHVMAIEDIRTSLRSGHGPQTAGGFLVDLADGLTRRIGDLLDGYEDELDEMEDEMDRMDEQRLRQRLVMIRRQVVAIRRHVAPQREALASMSASAGKWLAEAETESLRAVADSVALFVDDLTTMYERASVIQDELANRLAAQASRNTQVLSVVAAFLLPPSLLVAIFGANVGGIPAAENSAGFAIVVVLVIALMGAEFWYLRRRGVL